MAFKGNIPYNKKKEKIMGLIEVIKWEQMSKERQSY